MLDSEFWHRWDDFLSVLGLDRPPWVACRWGRCFGGELLDWRLGFLTARASLAGSFFEGRRG